MSEMSCSLVFRKKEEHVVVVVASVEEREFYTMRQRSVGKVAKFAHYLNFARIFAENVTYVIRHSL